MEFLFIDECMHQPLDLAALTGVFVKQSDYRKVRERICRILFDIFEYEEGGLPPLVELHGKCLFDRIDATDDQKIQVYDSVVQIVNDFEIDVIRIAYLNWQEIVSRMPADKNLVGLCFFGMQRIMQEKLGESVIIPVVDGIPGGDKNERVDRSLLRVFDQYVRHMHHVMQSEVHRDVVSIKDFDNLGEPLFANSEHNVMLQLVDMISHMLLQVERFELESTDPASEYKSRIVNCASKLNSNLLYHWKDKMRIG